MKIALIGYGKMGQAIEEIALQKGHEIVLKISSTNQGEFTTENIRKADVCIEFSTPHTAFENVSTCLQAGVPTICGSTAWLQHLEEANKICLENNAAFLFASNFSIGVNLFFKLNQLLARMMNEFPSYQVSIDEIHHTQKKDAPSGTAVTLAEGILAQYARKTKWVSEDHGNEEELVIHSKRIDPAPGTHSIHYDSDIDSIEIIHTAHNRKGFAAGALSAAEFIQDKKGIFTMEDVLKF